MNVEKEIALRQNGYRRTRRNIGDHENAADNGWYQVNTSKIAIANGYLMQVKETIKNEPCQARQDSILVRLGKNGQRWLQSF